MNTSPMKASPCSRCGYRADVAAGAGGAGGAVVAGDFSLCFNCGALGRFDAAGAGDDAGAFGRAVRGLRHAQRPRLTLRALAARVSARVRADGARCGCDYTYLCKIETGRLPPPSPRIVAALAAELHADPGELSDIAQQVPWGLCKLLKTSAAARRFFRMATTAGLDEAGWARLAKSLERGRPPEGRAVPAVPAVGTVRRRGSGGGCDL